jgi:hypothetical protein
MSDINDMISNVMKNVTFYDKSKISEKKSILSWGKTKTGKTAFMGTWPGLYIIDTDGSLDGLLPANRHVPFLSMSMDPVTARKWQLRVNGQEAPFKPFDAIVNILRNIRERKPPFDSYKVETLGIDSLTILSKMFLTELLLDQDVGATRGNQDNGFRDPTKKKATFDEYGAIAMRLTLIFDMIKDLDLNIICTAHEYTKMNEDTGTISECSPGIDGGFRKSIGHRFNGILYHERKDNVCFANMTTKGMYQAGLRNWKGSEKIELPTYEKIFGKEGGTK